MKKFFYIMTVALCLAISSNASAQYNKWQTHEEPADELTGTPAAVLYSYDTEEGGVMYDPQRGILVVNTKDGIFNYDSDYSGYSAQKSVSILIGTYLDDVLVNKMRCKFTIRDNASIAIISGTDGAVLTQILEARGSVRFVAKRYSRSDLDITIPCRGNK